MENTSLSDRTKDNPSLREYLEAQLRLLTEQHKEVHRLLDVALDKSERAMVYRLETMNQFREQITRERGDYVFRSSFDEKVETIEDRLNKLERSDSAAIGRNAAYAAILSGMLSLAALASVIVNTIKIH